jgi:hypothetical protein
MYSSRMLGGWAIITDSESLKTGKNTPSALYKASGDSNIITYSIQSIAMWMIVMQLASLTVEVSTTAGAGARGSRSRGKMTS